MFYSSRGFDGGSPPRNGAYNRKPYWAVKHLYMFVIDVGVAVLCKYGIGGTLRCMVIWEKERASPCHQQDPEVGQNLRKKLLSLAGLPP